MIVLNSLAESKINLGRRSTCWNCETKFPGFQHSKLCDSRPTTTTKVTSTPRPIEIATPDQVKPCIHE